MVTVPTTQERSFAIQQLQQMAVPIGGLFPQQQQVAGGAPGGTDSFVREFFGMDGAQFFGSTLPDRQLAAVARGGGKFDPSTGLPLRPARTIQEAADFEFAQNLFVNRLAAENQRQAAATIQSALGLVQRGGRGSLQMLLSPLFGQLANILGTSTFQPFEFAAGAAGQRSLEDILGVGMFGRGRQAQPVPGPGGPQGGFPPFPEAEIDIGAPFGGIPQRGAPAGPGAPMGGFPGVPTDPFAPAFGVPTEAGPTPGGAFGGLADIFAPAAGALGQAFGGAFGEFTGGLADIGASFGGIFQTGGAASAAPTSVAL